MKIIICLCFKISVSRHLCTLKALQVTKWNFVRFLVHFCKNSFNFIDFPLRGHMISYRALSNSYDTWDIDMIEQYVKDLAVFGTNEIGLVSPGKSVCIIFLVHIM